MCLFVPCIVYMPGFKVIRASMPLFAALPNALVLKESNKDGTNILGNSKDWNHYFSIFSQNYLLGDRFF